MKTFAAIIVAVLLSAAITTGCSNERAVNPKPQPINFSAKIDDRHQTRVEGTNWEANDAIGIFMFASGERKTETTESESANTGGKTLLKGNVKHIHTQNGGFRAATTEDALFYPADGGPVDFVAYYPFKAGLTDNKYPIDLSDQNRLSEIDLLYSNNAQKAQQKAPSLHFGHVLCRLDLAIATTDEGVDLDGLQVRISGAANRGTFDLSSGVLTAETGSATVSALVKTASDGTVTANAILIPEQGVDLSVHFMFDDGDQSVLRLSGKDFAGGYTYEYEISVDKDAKTVVVDGSTIGDWNDGGGGQYSVGKGSWKEFYRETFGSGSYLISRPLTGFDDFSNAADGITYLDDSQNISVKTIATAEENPFIAFPAGGGSVSISGLPVSGWSDVVFSCRVRTSTGKLSAGELRFSDGGGAGLTPSDLAVGTDWSIVEFPLSGDEIRVKSTSDVEIFIDDITLSGSEQQLTTVLTRKIAPAKPTSGS